MSQPPYEPEDPTKAYPQQPGQQPDPQAQQPAYGTPPPAPGGYGQPYAPYGQPYPPNPYQGFPQRRDNTTRNVLLVLGGLVVLFCGGIVAFFAWGISSIDSSFDRDYPGGRDNPLSVEEGEAFTIRGFDFDEGWSIEQTTSPGGSPDLVIAGVRATNDRDDEDAESLNITFQLFRENEVLATVNCSGGYSVAFGRSVTLDCSSFGDDVAGFDEIEVYDSSYSE